MSHCADAWATNRSNPREMESQQTRLRFPFGQMLDTECLLPSRVCGPVETNLTTVPDGCRDPSSAYKVTHPPQLSLEGLPGDLSNFDESACATDVRTKKKKKSETKKRKLQEQPVEDDPMHIDILPPPNPPILPDIDGNYFYQEIIVARDILAQQFRTYSDQRLKTGIEPIQGALSGLLKLRGVSYLWNSLMRGGDDMRMYGLLAQEVQQYFPHAVRESNGILTVNYTSLVAVLVEAVKALKTDVEELKERTKEHSTRLDAAETRLDRLEGYAKFSRINDTGVPSIRGRIVKSPDLDRALEMIRQPPGNIRLSLVGLGGMGKSTIARQLIDEPEVRLQFKTNVVWLNLLSEDDSDSALQNLCKIVCHQNMEGQTCSAMQQSIRDCLSEPTLIVLDNVWRSDIVSVIIDCGFQGIIVTTRLSNISRDLLDLSLHLFEDELALQFFPEPDRALGKEHTEDSKAIRDIVNRCKGLPLALDVVSRKSSLPHSWPSTARNLSDIIKSARSNSLYAVFDISIVNLPELTRRRLETFAIFPKGQVPLFDLAMCWNLAESPHDVDQIKSHSERLLYRQDVFELSQSSLVSCSIEFGSSRAQVHDLFHDYLLGRLSGSITFIFRVLSTRSLWYFYLAQLRLRWTRSGKLSLLSIS
jgi:hypothetical protein